jgi:DNA-directed RNA polymerase
MTSTADDKPEDLYTMVANVAMELLNNGFGGDEVKDSRDYWIANGGVTRKLAKRNTMTTPYGVTRFGMRDQLIEDFKGVYGFSMIKHANYLSTLTYESIKTVVKAASEGMAYLRAVASKVMSYNPKTLATLNWTAPNGFHAIQVYANEKTKSIRIPSSVGAMTIKLPSETSQLLRPNKQRNISAFSPNFIHSIDASHLCMTVDAMSKQYNVKNYAMIHDSFGVDANNASILRRTLREQFVKLYTLNDPLTQLVEHYANFGFDISQIPKPSMGTYDINEVLHSEYFFH